MAPPYINIVVIYTDQLSSQLHAVTMIYSMHTQLVVVYHVSRDLLYRKQVEHGYDMYWMYSIQYMFPCTNLNEIKADAYGCTIL